VRKLIINADDFGVCWSTNEAIANAFEYGVLCTATLMVPCAASSDAIKIAKKNPRIKTGLHITTNAEWDVKRGPVSPPDTVRSLVDENGLFINDIVAFAHRANPQEFALELETQYQVMVAAGLTVSHADSHMCSVYGLGLPSLMKEVLEFCAKHNLPFRFPRNPESLKYIIGKNKIPEDILESHAKSVKLADSLGVRIIDNFVVNVENVQSYEALKSAYFKLVANLPEGITDMGMHPSLNPAWRMRTWEYRLLVDNDFKLHINREGVVLAAY